MHSQHQTANSASFNALNGLYFRMSAVHIRAVGSVRSLKLELLRSHTCFLLILPSNKVL